MTTTKGYKPMTNQKMRDDLVFHVRSMGKLSTEAHLKEILTDLANAERELQGARKLLSHVGDYAAYDQVKLYGAIQAFLVPTTKGGK